MSAINFNTANQTYRQLLGNGLIYQVPMFQRDYSWTDSEWDDLWQDIENMLTPHGEPAHYMGYLVLQSKDQRNFDIIDGQQRLRTITIIVLAVLYHLTQLIEQQVEPNENRQREQQLRNSFIGYLDPVTLISRSKLNLNRNNNSFYQQYLVTLEPAPKRNLKATEHMMRKAYDWFQEKIRTRYLGHKSGAQLAALVESIADQLFFTVITVTNELNAFKVFETLNVRGVRLSSTDLLKNYLFSVVYQEIKDDREMQTLDTRWEKLVGILGGESFPDFLRAHWNSRNKFVRHSALFKAIKSSVSTRQQVFELMRNLEQDADVYAALPSPEDDLWKGQQAKAKYISELRMFNVRQLYPLLLAGYRKLSEEEFTNLLRACSIISFRYNVIGKLGTGEQESVYNNVAVKIEKETLKGIYEILLALKSIYPNDEQFRSAFAEQEIRTTRTRKKRIVKYILFNIERHITGADYDYDSDVYSVEHILPENPGEGWEQFNDAEFEQSIYRIGNMTILNKSENRKIGNESFEEKKKVYALSDIQITRKISQDNSEWNAERVGVRQRWLATQATAIWKISQLS